MSSIGKITGTVCRLTHNDGIKRLSLIIAAINYIVLFTCQYSLFNSIDFSLPESWKKLEKIISNYVDWFLYEEMNNKDLK